MLIKTILLALLAAKVATTGCGPKFQGKCECGIVDYREGPQYVVNCTDTKFTSTEMLENLPENTQVVIFTGNTIPELPWNVFGAIKDLDGLRVLDLSNNGIKEIFGKSLHKVKNVQRLILNHNDLSISPKDEMNHHHPRVFSNFVNLVELHLTNAFADNTDAALANDLHDIFVKSNLTHLSKLHLEQNEILGFQDKSIFCDLPNLHDLHLGDNLLTEIDFNMTCLKHLRFLDMERNRIEVFRNSDLDMLDKVAAGPGRDQPLVIDVGGNPLRCDCDVTDFYSWLQKTNVVVRNKAALRCHRPQKHGGDPIIRLTTSKCGKLLTTTGTTTGHAVTITALLVVLTIILIALVMALVYVSKDQLKSMMTPMLRLSKNISYTTIRNQDNPEQDV